MADREFNTEIVHDIFIHPFDATKIMCTCGHCLESPFAVYDHFARKLDQEKHAKEQEKISLSKDEEGR